MRADARRRGATGWRDPVAGSRVGADFLAPEGISSMTRPSIRPVRRSLAALAWALAGPALAGFGSLDQSFGSAGKVVTSFPGGNGQGHGMAVLDDGRLIVVGTVSSFSSSTSYDFGLVRYLADGSIDTTFGSGGRVATDFGFNFQEFANAVAIQPGDGKIVVVGTSASRFAIARYLPDGALDTTFGTGGRVRTDVSGGYAEAYSVLVQADEKIVVAGSTNGFGIARYNPDGSLDNTFNGDGTTSIRFSTSGTDGGFALGMQGDKYVVAGGICPGGVPCGFGLERFHADGTLDTTFGTDGLAFLNMTGGDDRATALHVLPDGKLLAAGRTGSTGIALARFTADGALDETFGTGGFSLTSFGEGRYDEAWDLEVQTDGAIITVGDSFDPGFTGGSFALTRHLPSGSPDTTFGVGGRLLTSFGGTSRAYSVAFHGADKIVLAGETSAGNGSFALAQYLLGENTPPGDVSVAQPIDETSGKTPVTLTLSGVDQGGDTTLTTSSTGPTIPEGFKLGVPPTYYDIETTASFDSAEVCVHYDDVSFRRSSDLKLLHFNGAIWVNVTTSVDRVAKIICGKVLSLSPFAVVEDICDVAGDAEPDLVGDCDVDLADAVIARRKIREGSPLSERDVQLSDVSPGSVDCAAPRTARTWCSEGDDALTLEDVRVIHDIATGLQVTCEACPPETERADRRLPGDVAPADGADNVVDDHDLGRVADFALGVEEPSAEALMRADVAPPASSGEITVVGGDERISILDLVEIVRGMLEPGSLAWPARRIVVTTDAAQTETEIEAWSLSVPAWPAWAPVTDVAHAACEPDDVIGSASEGGWSVGCVPRYADYPPTELAVVMYRAPESVNLDGLVVATAALDSDLVSLEVGFGLAVP